MLLALVLVAGKVAEDVEPLDADVVDEVDGSEDDVEVDALVALDVDTATSVTP